MGGWVPVVESRGLWWNWGVEIWPRGSVAARCHHTEQVLWILLYRYRTTSHSELTYTKTYNKKCKTNFFQTPENIKVICTAIYCDLGTYKKKQHQTVSWHLHSFLNYLVKLIDESYLFYFVVWVSLSRFGRWRCCLWWCSTMELWCGTSPWSNRSHVAWTSCESLHCRWHLYKLRCI